MQIDQQQLDPALAYQLLTHGVQPRPIAWISSHNADGVVNLAPFSFYTVASIAPPVLLFTQINPRDGRDKDTVRNLRANGECVVNVVSAELAAAMNISAGNYPPHVSELQLAGLAAAANPWLKVPGVAASPLRIACRLRDIVTISPAAQGGTLLLLDVVGVEVADAVLRADGTPDGTLLDSVAKLEGDSYCHSRQRFSLARPD